jgi:hypothetical protein
MSTNKFFYHGFWKTPFKTHSRNFNNVLQGQVLKALTNNLKSYKLTKQEFFFCLCNLKVAQLEVLKTSFKTKPQKGDCQDYR